VTRSSFTSWLWPIVFFELYLAGVALLFFYGPWPWIIRDRYALMGYLIAASAAIAVGYGFSWPQVRSTAVTAQVQRTARGLCWLKWAAIVSLVLAIPTSLARTGQLLPDVWSGLTDTGRVYLDSLNRLSNGNPYVVFEYLRFLASPLLVALLPLTIVFWRRAGWALRCASAGAILFYLAIFLARGQNKGVADTLVLVPFFAFVARPARVSRLSIRDALSISAGFVVAMLAVLVFFGRTQVMRVGGATAQGYHFGYLHLSPDSEHWLSAHLPEVARLTFESLARYLGQGYQAVALTFYIPHESTWGAGGSMFLARNADKLMHTDFFTSASLPALLEQNWGWPMYGLWHSIYPWVASDVGYIGALGVIAGFGYLLGLSWGKSLRTSDPLWLGLLALMLILFFYIPANNQVFQSGETTAAFLLLLAAISLRGAWQMAQRSQHLALREGTSQHPA
jgi:hypothetical protein